MNTLLKIILYFFLCTAYAMALAQEPVHKHISTASDFPTNTIYEMIQAKNGAMWLGSEIGLICYKGSSTKVYAPTNTSSKAVSNVMECADGSIWCQSFSGQFYYTKEDSLLLAKDVLVSGNYNTAVMLDGKTLCYLLKDKIYLYNTITKQNKSLALAETGFIPFINNQSNHYYLYNTQIHKIVEINSDETLRYSPLNKEVDNSFRYATLLKQQPIFFTKIAPHFYQNNNEFTLQNINGRIDNKIINNIYPIGDTQVAVLCNDGFYFMNNSGVFSQKYLTSNNTSCILKDNNNNTWIGTLDNGIYIIPNFQLRRYQQDKSFDVITKNQQYLIAGTSKNEIQFLNPTNLITNKIITDKIAHSIKALFTNPYTNDTWYSNYRLNQLNSKKGNTSFDISVNSMSSADSNHLLLSESNCLSIFPITEKDRWRTWIYDSTRAINKNRLILNNYNFSRCFSALIFNDTIFSANGKGLFKYYRNGEQAILFNNKTINAQQILKHNNTLYITTNDQGIQRYSNGMISPFLYPNRNAINEEIYKVKILDNKIFVLLYSGLDVWDMTGKLLYQYTKSDGFVDVDVADFELVNNSIVLASTKGIVTFPMDNTIIKESLPNLIIGKIFVNQKEYDANKLLQLSPKQKFIEIIVDNCDYLNIEPIQQFYKINDGDWLPFKGNKVTFNELASGEYFVKFKAINERGISSKQAAEVHFIIATPFFKTKWFITLMVLGLITIMLLGFRYRIQQINANNKLLTDKINLEKALHKSTLASIKSQMNPHFIFNALNTIQSYIYLNDKKAASEYLVKFSELTRLILDNSNQEKVDLAEELKAIELYLELEKMRFENELEYTIHIDSQIDKHARIPSMLIQPYIENAIKHGLMHKSGQKILKITISKVAHYLSVIIEDNGIGTTASKVINSERASMHQSFATAANKKRLDLLNETNGLNIGVETIELLNTHQQVIGTKVLLQIPLS